MSDQSWQQKLGQFLDKQEYKNYTFFDADLGGGLAADKSEQQLECNEESELIGQVRRLKTETKSMDTLRRERVDESELYIGLLYNDKVDNIKRIEIKRDLPPESIKFAIYDAYEGDRHKKSVASNIKSADYAH